MKRLESNSYHRIMKSSGYKTLPAINPKEHPKRKGLEGPFRMPSGHIVYYDPKEGQYYDPKTDMYISEEEYAAMNRERTASTKSEDSDSNPCWDNYEMVGTKKKNGKEVPNCVPKKSK